MAASSSRRGKSFSTSSRARSARRAARLAAGPTLLSPPRSRPGRRPARREPQERAYVVAGAAGSTALGSHLGASLQDRGPHRAIAGRLGAARVAGQAYGPRSLAPSQLPPKAAPPTFVDDCPESWGSDGNADGNRGGRQRTSTDTNGPATQPCPANMQVTPFRRAHVLCAGGAHFGPSPQLWSCRYSG
jgi:hypothetical protein